MGPIADYVSDDASLLLPLRLAFVSLCLAYMNNRDSFLGRVDAQREAARAWMMALLQERPGLLHAYTSAQHGKTRLYIPVSVSICPSYTRHGRFDVCVP